MIQSELRLENPAWYCNAVRHIETKNVASAVAEIFGIPAHMESQAR